MTDPVLIACDVAVLRALEQVGKKTRNARGRACIGRYRDIPAHEVYRHLHVTDAEADACSRLVEGAFTHLRIAMRGNGVDDRTAELVIAACHEYVTQLINTCAPHTVHDLNAYLTVARDAATR